MNFGHLSDFFAGVGIKRLTAVEVDPARSHQHEFQGTNAFRRILGSPADKVTFPTVFIRMTDEDELETVESFVTWSDVRRGKADRTPEYHLYYPTDATALVTRALPGDLLVVATRRDGSVVVLTAPGGSTSEQQLLWLFGADEADLLRPEIREIEAGGGRELGLAAQAVLEAIGIEVETTDDTRLEEMANRFGTDFPKTAEFSAYARETIPHVSPVDDPDAALVSWMEQEELLFRTFERHLLSSRLEEGFVHEGRADVEEFIRVSLSVQNRRKSRAGYALGNHLEALLHNLGIPHTKEARTERSSRPDFLFPSQDQYHDATFPQERLTMLGAKTSCKDRWRQVLVEADRIECKHLLTLEPGISVTQTDEMRARNLQLVVPSGIRSSYRPGQQAWLMTVAAFIELVIARNG